jgi:hypothetical protein
MTKRRRRKEAAAPQFEMACMHACGWGTNKPVQSKRPFKIFINGFFKPRRIIVSLIIRMSLIDSITDFRQTICIDDLNCLSTHIQMKSQKQQESERIG